MNAYEESEYEGRGWHKCVCCDEYKNPEEVHMEYGNYGALGTGWLCSECFDEIAEPAEYIGPGDGAFADEADLEHYLY